MTASPLKRRPPAGLLQEAKQQLVRDALTNAAIDLFITKGFDDTTVDDVARAAGVSRRSFFRYFSSKNDVLGQSIVLYGQALSGAIAAAPRTYTPLEVVRDAVLRIAAAAADYPRLRHMLQIAEASAGARQAQLVHRGEMEKQVAQAFAARLKGADANAATPRLLAGLTMSILDVTFKVWFDQETAEISSTAEEVIADLTRLFREDRSQAASSRVVKRR